MTLRESSSGRQESYPYHSLTIDGMDLTLEGLKMTQVESKHVALLM
jgi:hypothetical protein